MQVGKVQIITKLWICRMPQFLTNWQTLQVCVGHWHCTLTKGQSYSFHIHLFLFCPQTTHTALQERSWRVWSKASLDAAVTFCQISSTTVFTLCSGSWTDSQVWQELGNHPPLLLAVSTVIILIFSVICDVELHAFSKKMGGFYALAYSFHCSLLFVIPHVCHWSMEWHVVEHQLTLTVATGLCRALKLSANHFELPLVRIYSMGISSYNVHNQFHNWSICRLW